MNSLYYAATDSWQIPHVAIPEILSEMALDGLNGNEGIVLFLGVDTDTATEVTHLIKLRGEGVEKHPDQILISPALLNEVTDYAIANNVRLVGQVHSHGTGYGVGLSPTDRTYGIRAPHYLSLVAPDYALSNTPIHQWGAHVFLPKQGYLRLTENEAQRRIKLSSAPKLPFVTVGGHHEF